MDSIQKQSTTLPCVEEFLNRNCISFTGARDKAHRFIISFPDASFTKEKFDDSVYQAVINYITSIPMLDDIDRGFVVVLDRRSRKWSSVKTVTSKIASYFPGRLQALYILRPKAPLQRALAKLYISVITSGDNHPEVVLCDSSLDLLNHISRDQLTSDLGGSLHFDMKSWISIRKEVEEFCLLVEQLVTAQREAAICFPDLIPSHKDYSSVINVVHQQQVYRDQLGERRSNLERQRDQLMQRIRSTDGDDCADELPADRSFHASVVERAVCEMAESCIRFDSFWTDHQLRLQRTERVARFLVDFEELHVKLKSCETQMHLARACNSSSAVEVTRACSELEQVEQLAGVLLATLDTLLAEGGDIRGTFLDGHGDSNSSTQGQIKVTQKLDQSSETSAEHDTGFDDDVVQLREIIAEKCVTLEALRKMCREELPTVRSHLMRFKQLHDTLQEARHWTTQGSELLSHQGRSTEDWTLGKAREGLGEICAHFHTKVHLSALDHPKEFRRQFADLLTPDLSAEVRVVLKDMEVVEQHLESQGANLSQRLGSKWKKPQPGAWPANNVTEGTCQGQDEAANQRQRGHVMKELLQTERDYVNTLESIQKVFWEALDNSDGSVSAPEELVSDRTCLFGNWKDLLEFHHSVILPDLEAFKDEPNKVGRIFEENHTRFVDLYSTYCVQHSVSHLVLARLGGDSQPLIAKCRSDLGHVLPLTAYLMKPVQRVQKYQLLLGQLIKCCASADTDRDSLTKGLSTMLHVLRFVNDALRQVDIRGYQGKLSSLGRLLLQHEFPVWTEAGGRRQVRRLFLFERALLVCKLGETVDSTRYHCKIHLPLEQIGLTESYKGERLRFAVWLAGRSSTYIVQAPNPAVKITWTRELNTLLLKQFAALREEALKHKPALQLLDPHVDSLREHAPITDVATS